MTLLEVLFTITGFLLGCIVTNFCYCFSFKNLRNQVSKLRGQVYYWSRQMPIKQKSGRPIKTKSVQ